MSIEQRLGLALAAGLAAFVVAYWAAIRLQRWWRSVQEREEQGRWDDFNDVFKD